MPRDWGDANKEQSIRAIQSKSVSMGRLRARLGCIDLDNDPCERRNLAPELMDEPAIGRNDHLRTGLDWWIGGIGWSGWSGCYGERFTHHRDVWSGR
jgi:hypothetical protein